MFRKDYFHRWKYIFAFFICLIALIFFTYKDYGIAWDETFNFLNGLYFLRPILDFFNLPYGLLTNSIEKMGGLPQGFDLSSLPLYFADHIKGHGVVFDILNLGLALAFKNVSYEFIHLVKALTAVLAFVFVVLTVDKLLNKRVAIFSGVLLLLFPRFYGSIFFSPTDIPSAVVFSLTVFSFIAFIKSNQSPFKQILLGLALALTVNQRILFWYLVPVNFFFLYLVLKNKKEGQDFWKKGALIFFSQLFFMHLTHPYLFGHPLVGIIQMIYSSFNYPWNHPVLFAGISYPSPHSLPWYYLPRSMIVTIPLLTLFLFLAGNFYLIRLIKLGKNFKEKIIYFYLLTVFYMPVLLVVTIRPVIYDSWRQFMFLTVPIIIIAAFGLEFLLKIKSRLVFYLVVFIVFLNFFLIGKAMVNLHPYEYVYFNSLAGGLKGAYEKYETDYWGLGYREAVLWFNINVNKSDKKYKIYVEANPVSSTYFFKPNMELVDDIKTADYIFTYTRDKLNIIDQGTTIHVIKRENVPLIFIKKTY